MAKAQMSLGRGIVVGVIVFFAIIVFIFLVAIMEYLDVTVKGIFS